MKSAKRVAQAMLDKMQNKGLTPGEMLMALSIVQQKIKKRPIKERQKKEKAAVDAATFSEDIR